MRGLTQIPNTYFDKYKNKKVTIKPFDPGIRSIAQQYIDKLSQTLSHFNPEIVHRGSTAMGIAGKGEIELGVYPKETDWQQIIQLLIKHFGEVNNLEKNYARFNDIFRHIEIEIILMKGYEAILDKKLTLYLLSHPQLLKEYEKLKYKYCHSKKDYMIQKDKFFRRVIEMIPEE